MLSISWRPVILWCTRTKIRSTKYSYRARKLSSKKKTLFRRTKHVNISRNSEDALRSQIAKYIHGLLAFHFPSHVRLDVCPHALHALLCGDSATTLQSRPTSGTTMPDTHIGLSLTERRSESATEEYGPTNQLPQDKSLSPVKHPQSVVSFRSLHLLLLFWSFFMMRLSQLRLSLLPPVTPRPGSMHRPL